MAFTHTNEIRYRYTTGDAVVEKIVSVVETDGAEINVSEAIVTDASTDTTAIDLEFFEFTTAAQAKSVYLRLDGFNGALYANGSSGTKMKDLDNGIPYVWSSNSTNNFPAGATNPMVDSTTKLTVIPDSGAGTGTAGTIIVKVLYGPETAV